MPTKKSNHHKKLQKGKKLEERKPLTINKYVDVSSSTLGQGVSSPPPPPPPSK
jgi:hypothetical protein